MEFFKMASYKFNAQRTLNNIIAKGDFEELFDMVMVGFGMHEIVQIVYLTVIDDSDSKTKTELFSFAIGNGKNDAELHEIFTDFIAKYFEVNSMVHRVKVDLNFAFVAGALTAQQSMILTTKVSYVG